MNTYANSYLPNDINFADHSVYHSYQEQGKTKRTTQA
jgi:hypothetical protein